MGRKLRPQAKINPQAELRFKGPKIETAGRYYGKDQADRERSDLPSCLKYEDVVQNDLVLRDAGLSGVNGCMWLIMR